MGVCVLHQAGTLDELRARLASESAAMKATVDEFNDDDERFRFSAEAIEAVIDHQQFDHPQACGILSILINERFPVVSNDFRWKGYAMLAGMVPESALRTMLQSIADGSGFFARSWAHDVWFGCGYLDNGQVSAVQQALLAYAEHAEPDWREFIEDLLKAFERILARGSGDLFVVG
jgi:hypothetical protein